MQDGHHQDGNRLRKIKKFGDSAGGQNRLRPAHVGLHDGGPRIIGKQHARVDDRDRVDVNIDHSAVPVHPLDDLMDVANRRHTRPKIQKLRDARLPGKETYRPVQEEPVGPGDQVNIRKHLPRPAERLPVDREVVRSTESVVVGPGYARSADIDIRGPTRRLLHRHAPPLTVDQQRTVKK